MEVEKKFYRGLTYEEWSSQQDKDNLEFRVIDAYHKTRPGYNLEETRNAIFLNAIDTENQKSSPKQCGDLESKIIQEIQNVYSNWTLDDIKVFAPKFMSTYMKILQKISKDDPKLNIQDIEKRVTNYIDAGVKGNRVHEEVFGDEIPVDDYHFLAKWNIHLNKIVKILIEGSGYKGDPGHEKATMHSFKWNGYSYGFRSEMELDRDIKEIIELNRERYGTKSDFFKELIFKGVAIYSIIHKGRLGEDAKNILDDIEKYERREDEANLDSIIYDMKQFFKERNDRLTKIERNKKALGTFRDKVVKYISDKLSLRCDEENKEIIRQEIMQNPDLYRVLTTLERGDLVSREYVDKIIKEGVVVPSIATVQENDMIKNGQH